MRFNDLSYRYLPPRPSDHRIFGDLALSHHAPVGARAYAIDPVASGGGFQPRYHGAIGVTPFDELQLLAVNLVRSNGSQAFTGHYLVDMLPQSDLPSMAEHFVASERQVLPLVGVAHLRHPRSCQRPTHVRSAGRLAHNRRPGLSSGLPAVTPISAVPATPLAAAAATASPSPALLERLTPEQCASFLHVWERLPSHLRAVIFDLHGPDWTLLTVMFCASLVTFSPSPRRILVPAP